MVTITLHCLHWETRCPRTERPRSSWQAVVSLPRMRTSKSREPNSQRLSRSSPRGNSARLPRTKQSARPHPHLWRLSHHRVRVDQKKVAQLPPLSMTLVVPDPEDAASTTLELDERMARLCSKPNGKTLGSLVLGQ